MTAEKNISQYDVFISFKNLDEWGKQTKDSILAEKLYGYLTNRGLSVFQSNVSLEQMGVAAYQDAINDALDTIQVLIVVGCSKENLISRWVKYEWESFNNDILSDVKPNGRLFVYIEGMQIKELPRVLRQSHAFIHNNESMEKLYNFIVNALPERKNDYVLHNDGINKQKKNPEIFICYSIKDTHIANVVVDNLEQSSFRCWIAPRDVFPGEPFIESIQAGISQCKIMIFILSSNSVVPSPQISRELKYAHDKKIRIIFWKIEEIQMSQELEYLNKEIQLIEFYPAPIEQQLYRLVRQINTNF